MLALLDADERRREVAILFDAVPVALLVFDRGQDLRFINRHAQEMLRGRRELSLSGPIVRFRCPEEAKALEAAISATFADGMTRAYRFGGGAPFALCFDLSLARDVDLVVALATVKDAPAPN